jgi:hypothetical protein
MTYRDDNEQLRAKVAELQQALQQASLHPYRPSRLHFTAIFCVGIWIGVTVYSVSSGVAGCAHDIAVCRECPAPRCPDAPVTPLGEQCEAVCEGVGMRQIAHFNHNNEWYSCTCIGPGRWCEFHSDQQYPGNGARLFCGDAR